MASGAVLVLRNVRLTEELLERLQELKASRQRIVTAQDQERRRLERNIHDGAQQQLVALTVKVRLARQLGARTPPRRTNYLSRPRAKSPRPWRTSAISPVASTRRSWPTEA